MTAPTMKDIAKRLADGSREECGDHGSDMASAGEQANVELVGALSRNMAMRARIRRLESRIKHSHPDIASELVDILGAGADRPPRRRHGKASGPQH